ncbi:hypothetical protein AMTR_s00119p00130560 [Amborella trichopoda]|uniref:Uncharacterized protein n=1 Tax=Amborella trichopoda TaxID=13333 RepID=W1NNH7_AMBTC|nr:hypothetical protein AMTR_s00119p00130560 [Amborella trichopoda]
MGHLHCLRLGTGKALQSKWLPRSSSMQVAEARTIPSVMVKIVTPPPPNQKGGHSYRERPSWDLVSGVMKIRFLLFGNKVPSKRDPDPHAQDHGPNIIRNHNSIIPRIEYLIPWE